MRKYLCLAMFLALALEARAQLSYLDSVKLLRPRIGANTGFVIIGGIGDGWPWGPSPYKQGFAPLDSAFSRYWRFKDLPQCDSLSVNGFQGGNLWNLLNDPQYKDLGA